MICSPIYGRITDHYKMSRHVVLVASLFSLSKGIKNQLVTVRSVHLKLKSFKLKWRNSHFFGICP